VSALAQCAHKRCHRLARGDEYCSVRCCRIDNGVDSDDFRSIEQWKRDRLNTNRRVKALAKKLGGEVLEVPNPDLHVHTIEGREDAPRKRRGA
jgi:hypothetical protein